MTQSTLRRRIMKLLKAELQQGCTREGKTVNKANIDKYGWPACEALLNDAYEELLSK